MLNDKNRKEIIYKYFRDNIGIDLNSFTPLQIRFFIKETNKELDERFSNELERYKKIKELIIEKKKEISILKQELRAIDN